MFCREFESLVSHIYAFKVNKFPSLWKCLVKGSAKEGPKGKTSISNTNMNQNKKEC